MPINMVFHISPTRIHKDADLSIAVMPQKPGVNKPTKKKKIDSYDEGDAVSEVSFGTHTTHAHYGSCCSDHGDDLSRSIKSNRKEPDADWSSIRSEGPCKELPKPHLQQQPYKPYKEEITAGRTRRVGFGSVQVRQYHQTLGDNPCVQCGPPIQLDWTYNEEESLIPVDEYECQRWRRKKPHQMVLTSHQRRSVLSFYYGVSDDEMKVVQKAMHKIRRKRYWTKAFDRIYKLEDSVSVACYRMKKYFRRTREASS